MDIVITAWALDSYLELKHSHAFTDSEYKVTIRPDVILLKTYPQDPKFQIQNSGQLPPMAKAARFLMASR
jgi:hypothetical protein